jgi:protoheme IX farnesyltransferase
MIRREDFNISTLPLFKKYYQLAKPGIVYGNAIPTIAGFFLAAKGQFSSGLFFSTLIGISLVIASACVCNNYIDRKIDAKMERTKKRALVTKEIPVRNAVIYGLLLGILGFLLLLLYTNLLTAFIAFIGFFFYVVMYSIWKRRSMYGTIVGSISGAVPPVVGYTAVSNHFDIGALLLFMMLVFWQMPHFYAIAIFRLKDYAEAAIPVLPVKKGIFITKIHMLLYIIAFVLTTLLLTVFGYTGYIYFAIAAVLGFGWVLLSILGFKTANTKLWARRMFLFSLMILIVLCIMLSLDVS